jgi:hypothetical protein
MAVFMASCRHGSNNNEFSSTGRRVGSFKGLIAVELAVKNRIMLPRSYFSLGEFLQSYDGEGLPILLGAYDGVSGSSSLQNATPNAVNTMLWEIVMDGAATVIAVKSCSAAGIDLEAHFHQAAKTICEWPAGAVDHTQTLRDFWLDLMRYDAPQAEMEDWVSKMTAATAAPGALEGQALVKDLTQSILMNPYFLLEQ